MARWRRPLRERGCTQIIADGMSALFWKLATSTNTQITHTQKKKKKHPGDDNSQGLRLFEGIFVGWKASTRASKMEKVKERRGGSW